MGFTIHGISSSIDLMMLLLKFCESCTIHVIYLVIYSDNAA